MVLTSSPGPDLAGAIEKLARASVLVVGDAMLDRYVFGSVARISPEAPVPVLAVSRELAVPGGAGNVVRNLTALGAAAALVSVVGDDQAGSDLTGLIGGQPNVEPWLLVQGSRCTTVKTRFVADGQQLLRSDQEVTTPIHAKLAERLLRIAGDVLAATSVTVLSDYAKGVLAGETPSRIIAAAREAGRKVVADPRGAELDRFAGADVVVVTLRALEAATGMAVLAEAQMAAAARWLRAAHGFGAVVVNRRAEGFFLTSPEIEQSVPAGAGEMFDFTGAGDTAVAAIAGSLAVGHDLLLAVRIAALAMAVSATQPGMAVASAADLRAVLTPQGRALRKIVEPAAAADQMAHWRRGGLRTGLLTAGAADMPPSGLDEMRHACDRLVLAVESATEIGPLLADAAALPGVDLVCAFALGGQIDLLSLLRPDLLLDADADERMIARVQSWGGIARAAAAADA
jgi:D-beta-D-heptose 7-phosphate kinase/D-beta-D-heptose 1-phosphate adenosyltransferase